MKILITLDGSTASGKSTVARLVAQELDIMYLNSGLLYRALGYILMRDYTYTPDHLLSLDQMLGNRVMHVISPYTLVYAYAASTGPQIIYRGEDITDFLKNPVVDRAASIISLHSMVRERLLPFQRLLAESSSLIADGRDCGTIVFPNASHKFFLTALLDVRAQRWQRDQLKKGYVVDAAAAQTAVHERDTRDSLRTIAP